MNAPSQAAARQSLTGARLRKHSDYQRAYAAARKRQSASMSWFLAPQAQDRTAIQNRTGIPNRTAIADSEPRSERPMCEAGVGPRIGLTVGKVLGKAHDRNRIKRRMREALRRHVDLLPQGFDLIFHPRRIVLTVEFTKLEAEIVRILQQAKAEAARSAASIPIARPPAGTPAL